jgi:ribosomal protein L29
MVSAFFHYYSLCFLIFALVASVEWFFRFRRRNFGLLKVMPAAAFVALLVTLVSTRFNLINWSGYVKSDYIGQSWFPNGDSIEIMTVGRTQDRMVVKGHYNLISRDQATLALYITSTNKNVPGDARGRMQIFNGHGYFELTDSHVVPGLPHISMDAGGKSFAALYFGTKAEALEESAASWITNAARAASASSAEPTDLREARAKLAELRVDYSEQSSLVQRALARVKELEQMSKEEPNASTELREAKAHLAELRVEYSEQSSPVQKALAGIKALEQNVVAPAETSPTLAEQPPVVVETFPVSGARDVEPGETEIRVRFSKEMADGGWSWSTAWQDSTPETVGQIHYEPDQRTCVLKAKLEPGRTYAWWLNSEKFHNFTDQAGRAAVPYLLIFQTKPN